MIEEHKINKEADHLVISKIGTKGVQKSCGVSASNMAAFDGKYDAQFGSDVELIP